MAGWADLVRKMVAVADGITATLQANVTHYAWSAATVDAYNKVTWNSPTTRAAVVEPDRKLVRETAGTLVEARYKITFPRQVTIDPRDKLVLPDGTTGPILDVKGVLDPSTGIPYATEVWLGDED